MIHPALRGGIRTARASPAIIAVLYLSTLLLTVPVALYFFGTLRAAFAGSALAAALEGGFDYTTVHDLLRFRGDRPAAILPVIPFVIPVAAMLNTLFSGGILYVASQKVQTTTLRQFFRGCFLQAGPFLRLLIIMVILVVPLVLLLALFVGLLAVAAGGGTSDESVVPKTFFLFLVLLGLGMVVVFLIFDYARVILVEEGNGRSMHAIFAAARVVSRNFVPVAGLQLCLAGFWALTLAGALVFELERPGGGWGVTLTALVVHQIIVCARQAVRILAFSSQLTMYRSLRPPVLRLVFVPRGDIRAGSGI